jgi:iron uptake system component EfeO
MKGDGIVSALEVSGDVAADAEADPALAKAVEDYTAYVTGQSKASLGITKDLRAAIAAGDVAKAKSLYAASRFGWESVEPVAEAFGDLDPKMDLREADLEDGQAWTGWHVIEKALWEGGTTDGLKPIADDLVVNLEDLVGRIPNAVITPTSMANGAKELLDEVATGKVTGEEEAFSHTDLVDFKANVDGAQKVFELLKPTVTAEDTDLATQLETRFTELQTLLAKYGSGTDFVSYDTVKPAQRQELSDAVNALAEPLSTLAAAVS